MKIAKEDATLDAIAEPDDQIEIDVQYDITGGLKLYVNCNGQTILRIGRISTDSLSTTDDAMRRVVMR